MAKRKSDQIEVVEVEQVTASSSTAPFWEKYPNLLLYVLGAIALGVAGWWLYKEMVVKPKQEEAVAAMWQAEQQFGRDSFQLALNDPGGGFDGFLALADKFSGTPAGNMAHYYAGICYLQSGDFDNAIAQMEDFDAEGSMLPAVKYGVLGDCYAEKEDYNKALDFYEKAANSTENDLLLLYYLKKLGMLNERQGNKDAALKAYERIRVEVANPQSGDWRDVEKYIYRLQGGPKE
ncbi:MAG TPA: tetratricopeptide repeat protein [Saprospiraceae bacterium]|nr:tetratricopeptide repeat protein [Saprospiraceae bacterium]